MIPCQSSQPRQKGGTFHWNATESKYDPGRPEVYNNQQSIAAFRTTDDYKYGYHEIAALNLLGVIPNPAFVSRFTSLPNPITRIFIDNFKAWYQNPNRTMNMNKSFNQAIQDCNGDDLQRISISIANAVRIRQHVNNNFPVSYDPDVIRNKLAHLEYALALSQAHIKIHNEIAERQKSRITAPEPKQTPSSIQNTSIQKEAEAKVAAKTKNETKLEVNKKL